MPQALLAEARKAFHANLLRETLTINANGVVSNADGSSTPSKAIALGTGDIDCVYHFALYELQSAVETLGHGDATDSHGLSYP